MDLTSTNVYEVFADCLYQPGEDTAGHIRVDGVAHAFGFKPESVERHRGDIASLLAQLPHQFKRSEGGGYSFTYAPFTDDMRQWGEQPTAEQLLALGEAAGLVTCQVPRNLWGVMPGGVPYYVIDDSVAGHYPSND